MRRLTLDGVPPADAAAAALRQLPDAQPRAGSGPEAGVEGGPGTGPSGSRPDAGTGGGAGARAGTGGVGTAGAGTAGAGTAGVGTAGVGTAGVGAAGVGAAGTTVGDQMRHRAGLGAVAVLAAPAEPEVSPLQVPLRGPLFGLPMTGRAADSPPDSMVSGRTAGLADIPTAREVAPGRSGGAARPLRTPAPALVRCLASAAAALDSDEVRRILEETLIESGVLRTWTEFAAPLLRSLGERWADRGGAIEVEHAVTETLLGVLRGRVTPGPARVLLACVEGEQHTLPVHLLAAALAEQRIGCRTLGAGLPASAVAAAARRIGPSVVLLYARMPAGDPQAVVTLTRQRPTPRLVLAGEGWDAALVPATAVLVTELSAALDEIRACVTG